MKGAARAEKIRTYNFPYKRADCLIKAARETAYLDKEKIKRRNPSSLIQKILRFSEKQ